MWMTMLLIWSVGQIGKFDDRAPDLEYASGKTMEDIERCLIRQLSPPLSYRQPDRPDDVMLVWMAGGVSAGNAAGRVDLHRSGSRTLVKAWLDRKYVTLCAPMNN